MLEVTCPGSPSLEGVMLRFSSGLKPCSVWSFNCEDRETFPLCSLSDLGAQEGLIAVNRITAESFQRMRS